jgi:DNA (cytosine-5)-methyltransferase 3A
MAKKWQKVINDAIGCEPIEINSSLLSAQNRPRLYWTNIPNVTVPENKNICLDDILDNKADTKDVCHCKTIQKAFPKLLSKYGYIPERFNAYNASKIENKACALSRGSMVTSSCATLLFVKCTDGKHIVKNGLFDNLYKTNLSDGLYNIRRLSIKEMERLQTLPDNYTNIDGIGVQKRSASIGNGWTVDVIAHIFSFI